MKSAINTKAGRLISALVLSSSAMVANAGPIISATSGVINSGGPGNGTLTETFNQAGLSSGYTSGVTDFDAYIATNPTHTRTFNGFEWFGDAGTSSAIVTYNLGSIFVLDGLALWNEESSGIGSLALLYSTDDVTYTSLLSGLSPTDHDLTMDYLADVFSFSATSAQYIRFDMSRCPQPIVGSFDACSIGEVAFRQSGADVPAPATIALFGLGLAGLGWSRRKKA